MAKLESEGEFAEQLFVHGLGVQTAEGLAEWLHHEARAMLGIAAAQGRRYSWGYPAVPEQSEHLKVERLLDLATIGMSITDGYAPEPEQSTLALVAHHPQAIYFGTRQGRLLENGSPDDLIKGSPRDPSLFGAGEGTPSWATRTHPMAPWRKRTSPRWPGGPWTQRGAASSIARVQSTLRSLRPCSAWSTTLLEGGGCRYARDATPPPPGSGASGPAWRAACAGGPPSRRGPPRRARACPSSTAVRDLDRLQHDPVGDARREWRRGRRPQAPPHRRPGRRRRWRAWRARTAVTLTANSTPAAPAKPTRWSRPSAISRSQQEAHCSAQRRELHRRGQRPRGAGWRKTRRPSRTRSSERRSPSTSECSRAKREIAERGSSTAPAARPAAPRAGTSAPRPAPRRGRAGGARRRASPPRGGRARAGSAASGRPSCRARRAASRARARGGARRSARARARPGGRAAWRT